MCKVMEDMRKEAARDAVERNNIEIAKRLIADGMEHEKVADYFGLTLEKVQELAKEKTA